MRRLVIALAALTAASLGAPLGAQSCSTLAVSGGKAGTKLTFAHSGPDKNSFAFLVIGEKTGKTEIKIGRLGTLSLGLAWPFLLAPVGRTDGEGKVSVSFNVPKKATTAIDLHAQSFTARLSFRPLGLKFCTSNVVAFKFGGS